MDHGGIGENERFAFPTEPELRVEARLIQVAVEFIDHFGRIPERAEESDLRWAAALLPGFGEDAQQGLVVGFVGELVGDVEEEGIDAGVGEHLGMLAQHGRVVGQIIAEDRFSPMVRGMEWAPERAVFFLHGFGVLGEDFRDVVWSTLDMRTVPKEVENADETVGAWGTDLRVEGEGSAQGIGGDPSVTERVPSPGNDVIRRDGIGTEQAEWGGNGANQQEGEKPDLHEHLQSNFPAEKQEVFVESLPVLVHAPWDHEPKNMQLAGRLDVGS